MRHIDQTKCDRCGNCTKVCLSGVVGEKEGKVDFDACKLEYCIMCGHCRAVCERKAVVLEDTEEALDFSRGRSCEDWEDLFRAKRSVRNFTNRPVEREMIEQGIRFAQYAPSAANQHPACWTVVSGSETSDHVFQKVLTYCESNQVFPMVRHLHDTGKNVATVGAPCLVFVHAGKNALEPAADCAIALSMADMYWYKHGLGSCWLAFTKDAANRDQNLRKYLGIPEGNKVHGVLALGYPNEPEYPFLPWRKMPAICWVDK